MSDADAFLDAIFAQPDDDTPRLVYADWLEEHGQASYARFIRLQCEAARHKLWSPEANRLWEEIGRVWNQLAEMHGPLAIEFWGTSKWHRRGTTHNLDAVHFDRGFLRPRAAIEVDEFSQHWWHWWPWFPTPECTLICKPGGEANVGRCPTLSRVRRMKLLNWLNWVHDRQRNTDPWEFLTSSFLAGVESLDLSDNTLDLVKGWGVESLTSPGLLPRCGELRVCIEDVTAFSGLGSDPVPCTAVPPGSPRARLEARFGRVTVVPARGR